MSGVLESIFDGPIDPADATEAQCLFEQRAGIYVGAAHDLANDIASDLDPARFGIGWWAPHPDDRRRVFISDYLFQCANSVSNNSAEAALHLSLAEAAHDATNARMAHAVVLRKVGPEAYVPHAVETPKPTSLVDLLPAKLTDLHVAGFFRAVGSALDTMAAVAIAVAAFETPIVRADFRRLLDYLKTSFAPTAGGQLQQRVKDTITGAVRKAGPEGWLAWTLEFRNMLVHRGRRTQFHAIARDAGPVLYSADGTPIPRARIVMHLARDPRNSDLQAFFGGNVEPSRLTNVLDEDGLRALRSALEAVIFVVKELSTALLSVWRERRAQPTLLAQPREQWPDLAIHPDPFAGFEPGTFPMTADAAFTSQLNVRRFAAAAVDTANRHRWKTFTGS